jgi:hypothetical protein
MKLEEGTYKVEGTVSVCPGPRKGETIETFSGKVCKGVNKGHRVEYRKVIKAPVKEV